MEKNFLSICAIIRDADGYLEEWLKFHSLMGVDHFYLFNNADKREFNKTAKLLEDLSSSINYTHVHFPGVKQQLPAYNHWIKTYAEQSEFVAFLDVDEFLHVRDISPMKHPVADFLETVPMDVGVLPIHWLLFGSSGKQRHREGGVLERFTMRANSVNPHVKVIARTSYLVSMSKDPHSVYSLGTTVDENFKELPKEQPLYFDGTADKLAIAHFHVKSLSEFKKKFERPRADNGEMRTNFEEHFRAHDVNEVEDLTLQMLMNGCTVDSRTEEVIIPRRIVKGEVDSAVAGLVATNPAYTEVQESAKKQMRKNSAKIQKAIEEEMKGQKPYTKEELMKPLKKTISIEDL